MWCWLSSETGVTREDFSDGDALGNEIGGNDAAVERDEKGWSQSGLWGGGGGGAVESRSVKS